jgi:RecB family exonuclease
VPPVTSFSQSKLKTFNRCPKQYEYKYVQNLEPKRKERAPYLGTWLHACLESYYKTGDWKVGHQEYLDIWNSMFEEEREELSKIRGKPGRPLPEVVERIMRSYLWYYRNDGWEAVIIEKELNVPTPLGVNFKGRLDLVVKDEEGLMWMVDHKTTGNIPDPNVYHAMDPQLMLYPWATEKQYGITLAGVVYNYIKSKPPSVPQLTAKTQQISKRKILTDYPTLVRFLKEQGEDPQDWAHVLRPLMRESPFLKRYRLPRERHVTQEVLKDALSVVKRMGEARRFSRSISKDCTMCPYVDLCRAELNGFDSSHIRKSMFQSREEEDLGNTTGSDLETDPEDED